ncbi:MAG: hypothetical protein WCH39_12995 [Schlesneria sp.]
MTSIELKSRADANGVLNLSIPLGHAEANCEVRVVVEPLSKPMTAEEWKKAVLATAGSISDTTFKRQPQGDYETRDELP